MSSKCPHCGKTVYFAERTICEGKECHGTCVRNYLREKKEAEVSRVSGLKSISKPELGSTDYMKAQIGRGKEEIERKKEEQRKREEEVFYDSIRQEKESSDYLKRQIEARKEELERKKRRGKKETRRNIL